MFRIQEPGVRSQERRGDQMCALRSVVEDFVEPGTWNALGDDQRLACDRAPTKGSRASKWYVVVLAQNQVLMEPEDIKRIAQAALCETPGKQAEVSLVVRQDSTWIILLRSGEEEWAVKVEESAQSTPESIQLELEAEIRKLF